MACDPWRRRIQRYIDDPDDSERSAVEAHLRECPDCWRDVEGAYLLRQKLRAALLEELAPPELYRQVTRCILCQAQIRRYHRRRWMFAVVLALLGGIALGVLIAGPVYRRASVPTPVPVALIQEALRYHQLLRQGQLAFDQTGGDPHVLVRWLHQAGWRIEWPSSIPPDLHLKGVRLMAVYGRPGVGLFFVKGTSQATLFVWMLPLDTARNSGIEERPRRQTLQGYDVLTWRRGAFIHVLISSGSQDGCLQCHDPNRDIRWLQSFTPAEM